MKAASNGVLMLSTLDGWWREGFNGQNGWSIGLDQDYESQEQQDQIDAQSLYDQLENQIVPLFYHTRTNSTLPLEWVAMMKQSMRTLIPQFCMRRMVKEYVQQLYVPAMKNS